jgi:hypothetical protein
MARSTDAPQPRSSGRSCKVTRAVADLIRRAFELGAFQAGPFAGVGDSVRPWLVGVTNTIVPQDGLETLLWVPIVWNLVLDRVSPELFSERTTRIYERAKLLAKPDSHNKQFWQLAGMPGPAMLEEWAKRGWPIDIEVTKEEVAAVADAIDKEADRIDQEAHAAAEKRAGKKPLMLTEPLTKKKLGEYFTCHRNDVQQKVLDLYHHEIVGRGRGAKYRMHVAEMPPAYHQDHLKPKQ